MACIITYDNKQYTQKEFEQYFKEHFTEFVGEFINIQPDVILPIGTSGSGKSTFIKSLPQENLVVIEPDSMRVEFTGNMNDKSKDKEIYIEAANRAIQAIKQGKQVVFDTTNLTKDKRLPFIESIKKAIPTANIQYKLMELNPELAKQRIKAQLARGENRAAVSDETINRHAESYKQMLEDIKSEPITKYKELGSKQDIEGFKQFLKKDDESIYYKNLEDEIKVLEEDKIKIAEKRRNFREWINRFTTLNEVKNDNQKLLESRRQVFKDLGFTETYDNTFELKTSSYVTLISKKQALDDNPLIRFDGKLTGVKYSQKSVDGTYILTYKLDDITKTSIREAQIKGEMPFTKSDLKETLKSEDFLNSVSENIFDGLSPEETQIIKEKLESGEYNINCKL